MFATCLPTNILQCLSNRFAQANTFIYLPQSHTTI
jgi:hypothetical protein